MTIYKAAKEPDRFVVFISGDGGWNQGVVDMARRLARMDATVVGVDIRHYLGAAQATKAGTLYPAGDFSSLAQAVQKSLGFKRYHRPVVVGYSSGATLAYGTLVQSPSGIFQGGVGLGFCPDLKTDKPLAAGDGRLSYRTDPKLGFIYGPSKTLSSRFIALQGRQDLTCLPAATHAFIAQTANAGVIDLPKVGHGYSVAANWAPQFAQAFSWLYPRAAAAPPAIPTASAARLAGLPIIEVPAVGGGDTLAVLYSGDGGWAGIDRGLAEGLVQAHVPVVGYDSLRYFWTRRTPQAAAADLTAVLEHYMATWHKSKIVLAGYSFGADALPFIVARLSPEMRAHIRLVALVAVDKDGELEFHPGDWLNHGSPSAYPIAPTLADLKGIPMVCIYGDQDTGDACPTFNPNLIHAVKLSGGHHFNGDYAAVGRAISAAAGL
ncbi:AcvB/VirJ family lysyl-phosphatidylglycerol hydrolase [Phenylobacterium sp.]|uniref:AcvB/VirJ family lysyl-phosphatidylglycerol hydrolase n=1 Tax=Phenylobacterium sp. TaxID=1871053 RepID=UPI0039833574